MDELLVCVIHQIQIGRVLILGTYVRRCPGASRGPCELLHGVLWRRCDERVCLLGFRGTLIPSSRLNNFFHTLCEAPYRSAIREAASRHSHRQTIPRPVRPDQRELAGSYEEASRGSRTSLHNPTGDLFGLKEVPQCCKISVIPKDGSNQNTNYE